MKCASRPGSAKNTIIMTTLIFATPMVAAAGWAFLTYFLGGGFGLALFVFVVLKLLGK